MVASVDFVRAAWRIELPPAKKAVLIALADCVDAPSRIAWPSVALLERMTGWGERTVQRSLRELEHAGLTKARGKTYGGRGNTTRWELLFEPSVGGTASDVPDGKGVTGTPMQGEKGAALTPFEGHGASERVTGGPKRVSGSARLIGDPPETQIHHRAHAREDSGPASPVSTDLTAHGSPGRSFLLSLLRSGSALPPGLEHLEAGLRAELDAPTASDPEAEPR